MKTKHLADINIPKCFKVALVVFGTIIFSAAGTTIAARQPRQVILGKDLVRQTVRDFLENSLVSDRIKFKIAAIQVPSRIRIPAGKVCLKVVRPQHVRLRGRFPLVVAIMVNNKPVKKIRVMANVRLWDRALVTTRPLGRRQPITTAVVTLKMVDVTDCKQGYFNSFNQVIGMRTRNALAVETVLDTAMLELTPVVHRGDVVKMVAESRGLRVSTQGICLESGAPGQRIRVSNAKSRREVYAEVVNSATVRVSFYNNGGY